MGYSTQFEGGFRISPPLSPALRTFLVKFSQTRRMKRRLPAGRYGVEGEYFVEGKGNYGQDKDDTVTDANAPPRTQPELWCQWRPNEAGTRLEWDGGEKFYDYEAWLRYLIEHILAPNGYVLTGEVLWQGEDLTDRGKLIVTKNRLRVKRLE